MSRWERDLFTNDWLLIHHAERVAEDVMQRTQHVAAIERKLQRRLRVQATFDRLTQRLLNASRPPPAASLSNDTLFHVACSLTPHEMAQLIQVCRDWAARLVALKYWRRVFYHLYERTLSGFPSHAALYNAVTRLDKDDMLHEYQRQAVICLEAAGLSRRKAIAETICMRIDESKMLGPPSISDSPPLKNRRQTEDEAYELLLGGRPLADGQVIWHKRWDCDHKRNVYVPIWLGPVPEPPSPSELCRWKYACAPKGHKHAGRYYYYCKLTDGTYHKEWADAACHDASLVTQASPRGYAGESCSEEFFKAHVLK